MSCCPTPDPSIPRVDLYERREIVEAFPVDDMMYVMLHLLPGQPNHNSLINPPVPGDWTIIPKALFDLLYHPIQKVTPMPEVLHKQEAADFLSAPFAADQQFASAEPMSIPTNDAEYLTAGRPVIDAIINLVPEAINNFRFLNVDTLLWAAKVAFDMGISRLPFPLPTVVKDQLWSLLENAIRSLFAKNPVVG